MNVRGQVTVNTVGSNSKPMKKKNGVALATSDI
jgi:hypothetical protein